MKTVLILVISCQNHPYGKMIETSLNTWDSVEVEGCETIFYCGKPVKENTDKIIYFHIDEALETMGEKTLQAYEWALKNKQFDYIARVNSSCYVNKKELIKYVQDLPENNVFAGVSVNAEPKWMFGGCQFILSRDIVEKIVYNRNSWNHGEMEDKSVSYLMNLLKVPYTDSRACSLNEGVNKWVCLGYGDGASFEFSDWNDVKEKSNHFFYRVKIDRNRNIDEYLMKRLFEVL